MAEKFEELTLEEVKHREADHPVDEMPGSGRVVPSAWSELRIEMEDESAHQVGDLQPARVEHHRVRTKSHYASPLDALRAASPDESPDALGTTDDAPSEEPPQ